MFYIKTAPNHTLIKMWKCLCDNIIVTSFGVWKKHVTFSHGATKHRRKSLVWSIKIFVGNIGDIQLFNRRVIRIAPEPWLWWQIASTQERCSSNHEVTNVTTRKHFHSKTWINTFKMTPPPWSLPLFVRLSQARGVPSILCLGESRACRAVETEVLHIRLHSGASASGLAKKNFTLHCTYQWKGNLPRLWLWVARTKVVNVLGKVHQLLLSWPKLR